MGGIIMQLIFYEWASFNAVLLNDVNYVYLENAN